MATTKKRLRVALVAVWVLIPAPFVSCGGGAPGSDGEGGPRFSGDTLKTLQSLQRVDDYPLFVMTYFGSYGSPLPLKARNAGLGQRLAGNQPQSPRCTCFAALGSGCQPVFGRNFDWQYRAALVLFTDPPDGYASVSMVDLHYCGYGLNPDLSALESREGLLRAPRIPFDGMNEKGVAIGMMAVPYAQPPYDPALGTLADLAVIRLVLDRAQSTDHALSLIRGCNVRMDEVPLHYLIADSSGKSALVEFVNGRMEVLGSSGAFQVATNFIVHEFLPELSGRCWRYDRVVAELKNRTGCVSLDEARDTLQSVSQAHTMWSSAYNLKTGELQIIPGRKYDSPHAFQLAMKN